MRKRKFILNMFSMNELNTNSFENPPQDKSDNPHGEATAFFLPFIFIQCLSLGRKLHFPVEIGSV